MSKVTIRVPATTANLGPGFDAFGCALSLYTYVTFEETEAGLEITGCDESFTGPDNLAYTAYCAVISSLQEEIRGVKIHIDSHAFFLIASGLPQLTVHHLQTCDLLLRTFYSRKRTRGALQNAAHLKDLFIINVVHQNNPVDNIHKVA